MTTSSTTPWFFRSPFRPRHIWLGGQAPAMPHLAATANFHARYWLALIAAVSSVTLAALALSVPALVLCGLGLVSLGLAYASKHKNFRFAALLLFVVLTGVGQLFIGGLLAIAASSLLSWVAFSFAFSGLQSLYYRKAKQIYFQEVVPAQLKQDKAFWRQVVIRAGMWVLLPLCWVTFGIGFLAFTFGLLFVANFARYVLELRNIDGAFKWATYAKARPKLAPLTWLLKTLASWGSVFTIIGGGLLLSGAPSLVLVGWPLLLIGSGYLAFDRVLLPIAQWVLTSLRSTAEQAGRMPNPNARLRAIQKISAFFDKAGEKTHLMPSPKFYDNALGYLENAGFGLIFCGALAWGLGQFVPLVAAITLTSVGIAAVIASHVLPIGLKFEASSHEGYQPVPGNLLPTPGMFVDCGEPAPSNRTAWVDADVVPVQRQSQVTAVYLPNMGPVYNQHQRASQQPSLVNPSESETNQDSRFPGQGRRLGGSESSQ